MPARDRPRAYHRRVSASGPLKPEPSAEPPRTSGRSAGLPAGRIFGVPLVVSPAWIVLILLAMTALPGVLRDHVIGLSKPASFVAALALIVLVYGAILAHEASHVLVARALGLRVGRVVLQLLGAQSEVLDDPPTPSAAYLVAAVGPLTSVLLAGIGAAVAAAFATNTIGWVLASSFAWLNGGVAAFNLLPGLPLDGGQMLRAGVWRVTGDKMRAMLIAGWVGRVVAGLSLLSGFVIDSLGSRSSGGAEGTSDRLVGMVYLAILAFFIYFNASAAINKARMGSAMPRLQLGQLLRPALMVEAQLPLAEAVRRARDIGARALVIVDGRNRWSGIVSESAVQATPIERQPWMSVSDLARPVEAGLVLSPTLDGEGLVTAMQLTPASEYLVADSEGRLAGVLASADLMAALRAAGVH
jgi:Zn-dependent protease